MKQILEAFLITPLTGATAVRLAADSPFQATTGEVHPAGDSQTNYVETLLEELAEGMTVPTMEVDSTDDSSNPHATYTLYIVNSRGREIGTVFERWAFSASFGANLTYGGLQSFHQSVGPLRDQETYTKVGTNWAIQDALGSRNFSSPTVQGVGFSSVAHIDPGNPILVSNNDPRLDPASVSALGLMRPSVPPLVASDPIGVGNNDPRAIDISNYASFAAALTAIGSTPTTFNIHTNIAVTAGATVPSTLTMRFLQGGGLTITTGQTLIIQGPIVADPIKIFFNALAGQGTISFSGSKTIRGLRPELWGAIADGSTDCAPPLQACINALLTVLGGDVLFSNGTYKLLSTVTVGDAAGGVFQSINLKGQGVVNTFINWGGPTSGTMLKFWRNKYANASQIKFQNGVAVGSTVGVHLTGPASGTQSNNLKFDNCYFEGFGKGLQAGGGPLGTEAASELRFDICTFVANDIGLETTGSGNTINVWMEGCSFTQNLSYGLYANVGQAIHIHGGGSNANGVATFRFTSWQATATVENFRFELTPPEFAIDNTSGSQTLRVKSCAFVTNSTVPTYPVIKGSGAHTSIKDCSFGTGADTGWLVIGGAAIQNGQLKTLVMENNHILGTVPFYVDSGDSGIDLLKYRLFGNHYNGATQQGREGVVKHPNMIDNAIHGTSTFASSGTKAVTITTRESALYDVLIEKAVNEDIWVTSKTTTGFTLNSSNATSVAVINYVIRRQ